jgi:HEAT repeat protein
MTGILLLFERAVLWIVWLSVTLALCMVAALVVERLARAWHDARRRRIEQRYGPLAWRGVAGDEEALRVLGTIPARYRIAIARLIIEPLIDDRDPARIAATRKAARALAIVPLARRYLRSGLWWRRVLGLRALGLIQAPGQTAAILAALDDRNADVRGAALDALADLQDPASLPAIVARIHDPSLHLGRRAAALAAFGPQSEPFVLELAAVDLEHRENYARVLRICGTARARPALCSWMQDPRASVRIAALAALAHVGLDRGSAAVALAALESADASERATAAAALHGWTGGGDAAPRLARHLDDAWMVAVPAARALRSMRDAGRLELESRAARADLPGLLARQMLWETDIRC